MQTIWKYEVEPDIVIQTFDMPKDAIVLSFGLDPHGSMCFWAKVDDQAPIEEHLIGCIGTGWPADNIFEAIGRYACFIGTVTHGPYVWHLFDLGSADAALIDKEVATLRTLEEAKALETNNN